MAKSIMGHLVIGYPDLETSYRNARKYAQAGFKILELQIPFSHPTADGNIITQANRVAVEDNHVSTDTAFDILNKIHTEFPEQEVIIMTYLNKVYSYGLDQFVQKCKQLNIQNLIIPDLPFDEPLADQIRSKGINIVPVIAANITDTRLDKALSYDPDHVYMMSEFKITGQGFGLHENITNRVNYIRNKCKASIGIGFGISTKEHVDTILSIADYAIIGSALIKADLEGKLEEKLATL